MRENLGLERATDYSDITSDAGLLARLEAAYGKDEFGNDNVDHVDPSTGGLAEDAVGHGLVGELFSTVLVDQFTRLRKGDPFWSEGRTDISNHDRKALWDTTLSDVLLRNTDIEAIQKDVFVAMNRIVGTHAGERLNGTHERDFIYGDNGNDRLIGRDGGDDLQGGHGNDRLWGQRGDDYLHGGQGKDTLWGDQHHDTLHGGGQRDYLYGGSGKDALHGGGHRDYLYGGSGKDALYGGSGNDHLHGDKHDDYLAGGRGNDTLTGGAGDDMMKGGAGRDGFEFDARIGGDDTIEDFELGHDYLQVNNIRRRALDLEDSEDGLVISGNRSDWTLTLEDITQADLQQGGIGLLF